jgi:ribosome maturation factor RimP
LFPGRNAGQVQRVLREKLMQMLEPVIESMGYELVLLEFAPHKGSALLRLYIDATGGITLTDCERVSREVSAIMDVEDPIAGGYRLEVSSPGLDRPLVKKEHYERFIGETVRVQLAVPRAGRRNFLGVLRGLAGEAIELQLPEGVVELPLADIERARLVPKDDDLKAGSRARA